MSRRGLAPMVLASLTAWACVGAASADELATGPVGEEGGRWMLLGDLGATLVSRSSTASTSLDLARAQALGVGVDRRLGKVHLFARGEANAWRDRRDDGTDDFVLAFDLGLGAALDWGGGRLRSSLALGATILAVPTDVDSAGTLGAFVDVRPLGYAWRVGPGVRLGVVPLSFTLSVPVPTGIPLVSIQYRTTIFAERDL